MAFTHEGQPVEFACVGWLQQSGAVIASLDQAEQERRREVEVEPESQVRAILVFAA